MVKSPIVARINALLAAKGTPKQQFYKDCGITSASYSLWNTGKTNPSMKNLIIIAEYLGVSVADLMPDEEPSAGIKKDPVPKDEVVGSAKQKLLDALDGLSDSQIEKLIGIIEEAKKL